MELLKSVISLPDVLIDYIKKYIPFKEIVFINKEYYLLYHKERPSFCV